MKSTITLKIAAVLLGSLPAILGAAHSATAAGDPTQGRINDRQAQNRAQYFKCADFSLRVYNAALSQAGNNSAKIRAARNHYHGNLGRCRARFL